MIENWLTWKFQIKIFVPGGTQAPQGVSLLPLLWNFTDFGAKCWGVSKKKLNSKFYGWWYISSIILMMDWFCSMVDWQKSFSLISSWDHCQRSSPSWISIILQAGFEPAQNLSSGFVESNCAIVITTTSLHHYSLTSKIGFRVVFFFHSS